MYVFMPLSVKVEYSYGDKVVFVLGELESLTALRILVETLDRISVQHPPRKTQHYPLG